MAKWRDFLLELETPSNKVGPLHQAYERAVQGIGHAMIGAAAVAIIGANGLWIGLAVAAVYWLIKERGDLRRGGAWWDGIEDASLVYLGTWYGSIWWPVAVLLAGAYLMAVSDD